MRPQVPVPLKGLPLRATWGAQVANRINELCAMAPAGMLVREGFGGIGAQPIPQNLRSRTSTPKLWSFACSEENEERTGGWYNCRLQVGYTQFMDDGDITGRDLCSDGTYYVEVNVASSAATAEIKVASGDVVPEIDVAASLVRIPIGKVADGQLVTEPIDIAPVVYRYI